MSVAVTPSDLKTMIEQSDWHRNLTAQEQATLAAKLPTLWASLAAQDGQPGVTRDEIEAQRSFLIASARGSASLDLPRPAAQGFSARSNRGVDNTAAPSWKHEDFYPTVAALADHGVVVTIASFASRNADSGWRAAFAELGKAIKASPELLQSVHEVVIDRTVSGGPAARLEVDADGARRLILTFAFTSRTYTPGTLAAAPDARSLGKAVRGVHIEKPSYQQILATVAEAGPRPEVARYSFDRRFLQFLAALGRIPQIDTRLDTSGGEPFLKKLFDQYGAELGARGAEELVAAYPNLARAVVYGTSANTPVLMLRPEVDQAAGVEAKWTSFFAWLFRWEVEQAFRPYLHVDPDAQALPSLAEVDSALAALRRVEDAHVDLPDAQPSGRFATPGT